MHGDNCTSSAYPVPNAELLAPQCILVSKDPCMSRQRFSTIWHQKRRFGNEVQLARTFVTRSIIEVWKNSAESSVLSKTRLSTLKTAADLSFESRDGATHFRSPYELFFSEQCLLCHRNALGARRACSEIFCSISPPFRPVSPFFRILFSSFSSYGSTMPIVSGPPR